MAKGTGASCTRTIPQKSSNENLNEVEAKEIQLEKGDEMKMVRVGKPAPNFTAAAFHKGEFTEITLEDYKGKWVLLCFYPGDFTFV